jgi:hypothetical protein
MNPLATAGLLLIGIAQVVIASATFWLPAEEVHFRALQEFCKQEQKRVAAADARVYFVCMAEFGPGSAGRR